MPKSGIKVQDVAEVFIKYSDDSIRFFGCTSTAGLEKTVTSEDVRCGIGNVKVTRLRTANDMTVEVALALYSDHFIELQTGNSFATGQTVSVLKTETGVASAGGTFDITGTPVGDEVQVQNRFAEKFDATYTGGTVTITSGSVEGDTYTAIYYESVTADTLDFGTSDFPENVELILHTIAYDINDDSVVADLYWTFPTASPDGNLALALATGTGSTPTTVFDILDPMKTGSLGTYAVVATS